MAGKGEKSCNTPAGFTNFVAMVFFAFINLTGHGYSYYQRRELRV